MHWNFAFVFSSLKIQVGDYFDPFVTSIGDHLGRIVVHNTIDPTPSIALGLLHNEVTELLETPRMSSQVCRINARPFSQPTRIDVAAEAVAAKPVIVSNGGEHPKIDRREALVTHRASGQSAELFRAFVAGSHATSTQHLLTY
jgi:hypothetical protein